MNPPELAVVMPVYNEEASAASVMAEWQAELTRLGISYLLLPVNDGSRDRTGEVLRRLAAANPGLVHVIEQANAGHGRACRAGYDLAVAGDAAWVLQIDSDGQCDPSFFAAFWERRHDADCLFGVRTTRDDGLVRTLLSLGCRAVMSIFCGMDLRDANVPYRLIRAPALAAALGRIPADFDMQNVALTLALRRERALRWAYVPIHFRHRQGGRNSLNVRRILLMGWELLRNLRRVSR